MLTFFVMLKWFSVFWRLAVLFTCCEGYRIHRFTYSLFTRFPSKLSVARSAIDNCDVQSGEIFAGVNFGKGIIDTLHKARVATPTPIQEASLKILTKKVSAICHAETGSGKSLCYILPLLKRLEKSTITDIPRALIIVPTLELAAQVSSDITNFIKTNEETSHHSVYLCIKNQVRKFESVNSSVIVGTPLAVWDSMQQSSNETLKSFKYIVLDEVDRLINVLGRYATKSQHQVRSASINPTQNILRRFVEYRDSVKTLGSVQFIAASATVGRPLRRELSTLIRHPGQLPILRSETLLDDESVENYSRPVTIPRNIEHVAYVSYNEVNETLSKKMVAVTDLWLNDYKYVKRGIVFVPTVEDALHMSNMLQAWKLPGIVNLQSVMGINVDVNKKLDRNRNPRDRNFQAAPARRKVVVVPSNLTRNAAEVGVGHIKAEKESEERQLLVTSVSSARGLHVQDVDIIFIMDIPLDMDEYLHMAGRTGRVGNKNINGRVVSVVNDGQFTRLKSWEQPLQIKIDSILR